MPSDAVVTVRLPSALKRRVDDRARASHRSLSAQVLHDLTGAIELAPVPQPGKFLGRFAGASLPSDGDVREVRSHLWRRLSAPRRHG